MKPMTTFLGMIFLVALMVYADSRGGIAPRQRPSDYAEFSDKDRFSLGVSSLSRNSILRNFSTDLTKGFIVVEVGLFPAKEQQVEIDRSEFVLKAADGSGVIRSLEPQSIAGFLQRSNGEKREVALYPTVGVGYESGTYHDPYSGRQRVGGLSTGVGLGVGIGKSGAGASSEDRRVMEAELSEKEFPAGIHSEKICGYLYFPVAEKNRKKSYLFEGTLASEKISLLVKSDKQ
jgi:hypothetical protein